MRSSSKGRFVTAAAAGALFVCAALSAAPAFLAAGGFLSAAHAQTHEGSGGSGSGGPGGGGSHDDGHDDTDHGDDHGSGGQGHGGDADGGGREGVGGGRGDGGQQAGRDSRRVLPVWAREGIPEVELGRLNAARSPDRVLDRALDEAKSVFSAETAGFYRLDLDGMIEQLSLNWDNVDFIDSPLQNLALLQDALDGYSVLSQVGIDTDVRVLQAVFLGTASDKQIPITVDTVLAISAILGNPVSLAEAQALAEDAEKVRVAIVTGHG